MIEIYLSWNAVCALKVILAMEEKGIDYRINHIDLGKFEQHSPEYLKLNPLGVVPTMLWDGEVITESTVMCEFLEDAYPQVPLLPKDPLGRARVRQWGKLVDDVVHPSIRPISFMQIVRPIARAMSKENLDAVMGRTPKAEIADLWRRAARAPYTAKQLAEYLHKIETVLDRMEQALQSSSYLVGDGYSLADAYITPYFRRLIQLNKTALWEGSRPAVAEWLRRVQARPSYAVVLGLQTRYAVAA
jgi:glutathione S-transferase